MTYELYYWPTIQGRGEFIRLALEAGGGICAPAYRPLPHLRTARRIQQRGPLPALSELDR